MSISSFKFTLKDYSENTLHLGVEFGLHVLTSFTFYDRITMNLLDMCRV